MLAARIAALALAGLAIYGIAANGILSQPLWSAEGLRRFAWFTAGYAVLVLLARRYTVAVVCAAGVVYAAWVAGIAAVAATAAILLAAYGIGYRLRATGVVAVALGLGCYSTLAGILVRVPVNTAALYAVLIAAGLACLPRERPRWPLRSPWMAVAPAFAACVHLFAALSPEAGSDALAMHLTVPAWVAEHRNWHFDVDRFSWALMPMGGDWLHTVAFVLGGEAAARLVNFAMLLLIAAVVYSLARRAVDTDPALLAATLWLSTPVTYLATGSLFIENYWTLMVCAAVAAVLNEEAVRAGALAGMAMAGKLLAAPVAAVTAVAAVRLRGGAAAAGLLLALGLPPYVEAWLRTGNPAFPNFNSVFQSPLFDTSAPAADSRYPPALTWNLLYDAAVHSPRYLEGYQGSLGFHYLILVPATVFLLRRNTSFVTVPFAAGMLTVVSIFSAMGYLRYIYPALALFCVAGAVAVESLGRAKYALLAVAGVNIYLFGAATPYTRDFAPPSPAPPMRALTVFFNETARGAPVAFFDDDAVAGLAGRAYTASWRTWTFERALDQARSPGDVWKELRSRGIRHAIAPSPRAPMAARHPAAQGLLRVCGAVQRESGPFAAWLLDGPCDDPDRLYYSPSPAGPGSHDDTGPFVSYHGHWLHDRQFAEAAGHTVTYSNVAGDWLQIRFTGRRLRYVYTAAPNRGAARVTMDGTDAGTLDQRASAVRWQASSVFETVPGQHTLRVELTGGGYLDLDRFVVE